MRWLSIAWERVRHGRKFWFYDDDGRRYRVTRREWNEQATH